MSNEYSYLLASGQTLKMRRFSAGGSLTWNGTAFVAIAGVTFGTQGVIDLTEVSAGIYSNNGSLGSAVEDDEFGLAYVGAPVAGSAASGPCVPTGAGGSGGGSTTVIQGSSVDGAVSGTPIGPDLNITQNSLFQYELIVQDYAGPSISGGTVALKIINQDDRLAGIGSSAAIGSISAAMDDTSLVLTITVLAAGTASLETSPPNESLHYAYTCVLTTSGGTVYAVVSGATTIVRAAV